MESVAIVGVGLIGGSFGLALRQAGFEGRIIGVSSPGAIRDALARGAIDEAAPLEEAVRRADLVYLAQPIRRIVETLRILDQHLRPGALVTDAGSTKAAIVAAGRAIRTGQFLGGHPMAGKEKRGAMEADADLFEGRTYVLTPEQEAELNTPAAREFTGWVQAIGARVIVLEPDVHDRVVAFTSHLPQLLSTGLASVLASRTIERPEHMQVAGPGLIDTTRLACSSYDIWRDILGTNAAAIDEALAAYIDKLVSMRAILHTEGLRADFERGSEFVSQLRKTG